MNSSKLAGSRSSPSSQWLAKPYGIERVRRRAGPPMVSFAVVLGLTPGGSPASETVNRSRWCAFGEKRVHGAGVRMQSSDRRTSDR